MEKFWKWMKNKGYGDINRHTKSKYLNGQHSTVGPTEQMLIGYKIEYLCEQLRDKACINLNGIDNIDTLDAMLNYRIKENEK